MLEYKEHTPVLKDEVLEYLKAEDGGNFIDCTYGFGGHTNEILKFHTKVLGIEWDKEVYSKAEKKDNLILVNDNYKNIDRIVEENSFNNIRGILIDLGLSLWDIKESQRGFSFKENEDLDMRFNTELNPLKASDILNDYSVEDLTRIFTEYGDIKKAEIIAVKIKRSKKRFETVSDLLEVLDESNKLNALIFQALRIEVNSELKNLKEFLPKAIKVLDKGGRLVVISFHSLEDRIVKHYFKDLEGIKILTKRPITVSMEEIRNNKRSQSAKLRVIEKL